MKKYENKLNKNVTGINAHPSANNASLKTTLIQEVGIIKQSESLFDNIDKVKEHDITSLTNEFNSILNEHNN